MVSSLVGYTGFVGSNLALANKFNHLYNSSNIVDSYDSAPDLLVYAGVTGTKYLANKFPEKDNAIIESAKENIKRISAKKVVLISTIDTFINPDGVDEDCQPTSEISFVYGYHRRLLEEWIIANVQDYLIVRLPGIYGANLRKNYIYDMINPIPQALTPSKFKNLLKEESRLGNLYVLGEDGFYHPATNEISVSPVVRELFRRIGFSALNFTDTRGTYQYYNLKYLWPHIQIALDNGLTLLNIATEPFKISELYRYVTGNDFDNEMDTPVAYYNFKTKFCDLFFGRDGYIFTKEQVMKDIKSFIEAHK